MPDNQRTDRPLTIEMQRAIADAKESGGQLRRWPGGFWDQMTLVRPREMHHFAASTIDALVRRGLMEYSAWKVGRKGRFPIAVTLVEETP